MHIIVKFQFREEILFFAIVELQFFTQMNGMTQAA
jgi:hypothetical protein